MITAGAQMFISDNLYWYAWSKILCYSRIYDWRFKLRCLSRLCLLFTCCDPECYIFNISYKILPFSCPKTNQCHFIRPYSSCKFHFFVSDMNSTYVFSHHCHLVLSMITVSLRSNFLRGPQRSFKKSSVLWQQVCFYLSHYLSSHPVRHSLIS